MKELRVGAEIGFELGDDYMIGLVFHVDEFDRAHFVGKNACGGTTTTWFGQLYNGQNGVVTSRGRIVDAQVLDFSNIEGYDDANQLLRNILAIAEKRENELSLESYDSHLDEHGHEDELGDELYVRQEILLLRKHLDTFLSKNKNFAFAFEKEKKFRHICPVCGGKTSVKKVEAERQKREHYIELVRNQSSYEENIKNMECEISVLNKSNKLMEEELERKRKQVDAMLKRIMNLRDQVIELRSRGFWERIFNR